MPCQGPGIVSIGRVVLLYRPLESNILALKMIIVNFKAKLAFRA